MTQMRPLYQKLNRMVRNARLSAFECSVFRWWAGAIAEFTPRLAVPRTLRPHWILYTDDATNHPEICALLFSGRHFPLTSPVMLSYGSRRMDTPFSLGEFNFWPGTSRPRFIFRRLGPLSYGKSIWIYLDSNNSLSALVRGDSNTDVIAVLVARFWKLAQTYGTCAWFPRVRATINPADLPSMGRILPYNSRRALGFRNSMALFRRCRSELHRPPPPKVRPFGFTNPG